MTDSATMDKFKGTLFWRIQSSESPKPRANQSCLPPRAQTPPRPKRQQKRFAFEQLSLPQQCVFEQLYNRWNGLPVDEDALYYSHHIKTVSALQHKGWIKQTAAGAVPTYSSCRAYERYLKWKANNP